MRRFADDREKACCPNCGHHTEGEPLCPNCGAVLAEEDEEMVGFHEEGDDVEEEEE